MSVKKYKATQASTENPRQTEYRLFAEVTKALMAVSEVSVVSTGLRPKDFYKAVDWNRRLWLALGGFFFERGNSEENCGVVRFS